MAKLEGASISDCRSDFGRMMEDIDHCGDCPLLDECIVTPLDEVHFRNTQLDYFYDKHFRPLHKCIGRALA